jgi:acyl-CoA oxidase
VRAVNLTAREKKGDRAVPPPTRARTALDLRPSSFHLSPRASCARRLLRHRKHIHTTSSPPFSPPAPPPTPYTHLSRYHPLRLFDTDIPAYFYLGELLALVDLSATIKLGVQYSLWGGSVLNLGTARHRAAYAEAIDAFRMPGCFAMTELGHGSNVAGLKTEAVFDGAADEWVITTPDDGALKWWIGNAAEDGQAATVFARLKVPPASGGGGGGASTSSAVGGHHRPQTPTQKQPPVGLDGLVDHGVHAFIVPLRDGRRGPDGLLPGVQVIDCGVKVGLQGVDNGALRFSGVRVPRLNLLDRFAQVGPGGVYTSTLSPSGRFAATLGELTGGRVGLAGTSVSVLKGAVTIAIRYAATRLQFGPPGGPEVAVLDYPSQQGKLVPLLATAYALHFACRALVGSYEASKAASKLASAPGAPPEAVAAAEAAAADVHATSAGLKAYATSYTARALSTCREACGGHGYAAANRLGGWRSDQDIFVSFEGDNTVLRMQVAGALLKRYRERFSGHPLAAGTAFLRAWAGGALPANPLLAHDTSPRHLRDPEFLKSALRHRTRRLLFTAAARLRKHARGPGGAFGAWNRCAPHLLALANAHVECQIFEAASAAAAAAPESGGARPALKAMADTFALTAIEADVTYRNDESVGADKAKAISRLLEGLRAGLAGQALPLVAAFAIPDHILRAPIGVTGVLDAADPYAAYLASTGWRG